MRVECGSVAEFIAELIRVGNIIPDKIVRIRIDEKPLDSDPENVFNYAVGFWATALIDHPARDQKYVLEVGVTCGKYNVKEESKPGKEMAEAYKATVEAAAKAQGLIIAGGKWELY